MAIRLSELNAINGEPAPQKQPTMPQPEQVEETLAEDENVETLHEGAEAVDDDIDVMSFPVLGEELDDEEEEEEYGEEAEEEEEGADNWLNAVINRVQDAPEDANEDDSWVDEEISDEDETDYSDLIHGDYEYDEEEYEEAAEEYEDEDETEYEYDGDEEYDDEEYEEEYDYDDQPIEPPPAEFVETDEDGLYILRDEDGDLYPWAEAFIIGLPRLDAMNKLADEDYEIWDSSNGTDTPETPQESTNHQTDEEDTNTPTEEPQQVSVDDAAASATDEPATTIKDRALKVLDALAGFLHKGSRIPLFGHLFAKSIPGTSTGRGLAGVFLALLVFLGGSFINNQIVGDRTFPVAGDSTIMLPDDGKVTATGVERKDGKYFIILKNEGEVTAGTISGAVKAAGSDAYNPAAWFNKEKLGSCSFTAEDIPAETEAKAPLTCDTDMKGKGSMEFTDVTLHTEDV
jgi:hypothetical protein